MTALYTSPDAAFVHYHVLRDALGSARAFDPAAQRGLVARRFCEKCGSSRSRVSIGKLGVRTTCVSCGTDWPHDEVIVPKGVIQSSPRSGVYEDGLVTLATLERLVIAPLTRWERRAWRAFMVYAHYSTAASSLQRDYRWAPFTWTPYRTRKLIERGRETVERRLMGAGYMERQHTQE